MKRFLICAITAIVCSASVNAAGPFSGKFNTADVKAACDTAIHWQMLNYKKPNKKAQVDWVCGALYIGMYKWAELNDDKAIFDFLTDIGNKNDWSLINTRPYHADNICTGQMYLKMFEKEGKEQMAQATKDRAYYIANHPNTAPLDKTDPIGKDCRWSWCDALFMAPPVYATLYRLTGEQCYLDYMDSEFKCCADSLYDKDEKLFYRDIVRIPHREPNGAKEFWGRGNGWVFGGLPLIMENLPVGHPSRAYYEQIFKEMASAILKCQGKDGSWRASLLAAENYPDPENSSSTFFCYGFAWGINNGLLDPKVYRKPLEKGWKAIVGHIHEDGMLGNVQQIGAAPVKGVAYDSTQAYGYGSLLLAGTEITKLLAK